MSDLAIAALRYGGTTCGIMTIVNTLSEEGQTMTGSVEIVDTGGRTTTTGKMTHRRE